MRLVSVEFWVACMLSHVQLFATPWTISQQAPLSMECSRQEYWSEFPYPIPEPIPNTWIELAYLGSPALVDRFFTNVPPGKHFFLSFFFFFFFYVFFFFFFFLICGGFCHTLKWNRHGFTCVPHPDPPSHLPLHPLPLGFPSAPGPSACLMHPTWAGDLFHPR